MVGRVKLTVVLLSALVVIYGLVGGSMKRVSARETGVYTDLGVFVEVLNKVTEDYVEKPDLQRALTGALHGMLEALDPYSSFVDRATYEELTRSAAEATASPGLVLSKRYGYVYVVAVVPGSSAEREGLRSGDLVEAIGSRVTTETSLWEAERLLWGPPETKIGLRVVRARRAEPSAVELTRAIPAPQQVNARILEEGIGFLRIPDFEQGAEARVLAKLKSLRSSGVQGLLVDVRGAARGVLEEAIGVSGLFLPKGKKIVTVKGREGEGTVREGEGTVHLSAEDPTMAGVPIVLLINGGTSGPAEVFASALRDNDAAFAVGEKTNGQGSLQEVFSLEDGSALFISTQLYYRPSGKPIQDQNLRNSGVAPDVRAPDEDFMTNFFVENAGEDDKGFDEGFYRRLNEAVQAEQFRSGLQQIRKMVLKKAA
jgi:carboxyl-terminal processing protease